MKYSQLKLKTQILPLALAAAFTATSPYVFAVDLTVDSNSPKVDFDDTTVDINDSDLDASEWKIRGQDDVFEIVDDSNDDLLDTANNTTVIKIEALGNYLGHAKITTPNTENSIVIRDTGDIEFANGAMKLDETNTRLGLGTIAAPDTSIHINGTGTAQLIKFENTSESTWTAGQNDASGTNLDGDFQINIATNNNGGPTGTIFSIKDENGRVGIGTDTPDTQLHIFGGAGQDVFAGMGPDLSGAGTGFNYGYAGSSFGVGAGFFNVRPAPAATGVNPSLRFMTANVAHMIVTKDGDVGIGNQDPQAKLHVSGDIRTDGSFFAGVDELDVPDYVFADDYQLMPLADLKAYIAKESHLPGVKSAKEVAKEGLNLSMSQMALLEKVEELTLYTLDQQEQLDNKKQTLKDHAKLIGNNEKQLADQHVRLANLESMMGKLNTSEK